MKFMQVKMIGSEYSGTQGSQCAVAHMAVSAQWHTWQSGRSGTHGELSIKSVVEGANI